MNSTNKNAKTKILIIEDDFVNRQLLLAILRVFPTVIIEAENGIDGIEFAEIHKPDIILMDINMPCIDGFEAALKIRENPELKNIPIIACTALSNSVDNERIKECFVDKIQKPYTIDTVVQSIRKFITNFDEITGY